MKIYDWQDIREYVQNIENSSASWKSDQQSLLAIIDWAMKQRITPPSIKKIEITKLRAIIKHAKKAIKMRDVQRLLTLFEWVASLTTIELRHRLGISEVETIEYEVETDGDEIVSCTMKIRPDQLEKISSLTKSRFNYEPKNHQDC